MLRLSLQNSSLGHSVNGAAAQASRRFLRFRSEVVQKVRRVGESGGRCRRMSAASIGQLNTLLKLTLRPIGLVVYERPNFSAKRPRPAGFVPTEQRRVRPPRTQGREIALSSNSGILVFTKEEGRIQNTFSNYLF